VKLLEGLQEDEGIRDIWCNQNLSIKSIRVYNESAVSGGKILVVKLGLMLDHWVVTSLLDTQRTQLYGWIF